MLTVPSSLFLSTLPARGATLSSGPRRPPSAPFLSTLPARGATFKRDYSNTTTINISIHAPREGSDCKPQNVAVFRCDFYPRSPRGERPTALQKTTVTPEISIHAPREGSDKGADAPYNKSEVFLSTLPARGATSSAHWRAES